MLQPVKHRFSFPDLLLYDQVFSRSIPHNRAKIALNCDPIAVLPPVIESRSGCEKSKKGKCHRLFFLAVAVTTTVITFVTMPVIAFILVARLSINAPIISVTVVTLVTIVAAIIAVVAALPNQV